MIPGGLVATLLGSSASVQVQGVTRLPSYTGTGTVTVANVRAGDLIVYKGTKSGSSSVVTLPTGFVSLYAATGPTTAYPAARLAYKVATGSETDITSNAELSEATIYRGFAGIAEIGAISTQANSGTSITVPALGVQTGGKSLVEVLIVNASAQDITAPASMTHRDYVTTGSLSLNTYDTGEGVSSFTSRVASASQSTLWRSISVEIKLTTAKSYTVAQSAVMPDCRSMTVVCEGGTGAQGQPGQDLDEGYRGYFPGGQGGQGGLGGKSTKNYIGDQPTGGSSVSLILNTAQATFGFATNPSGFTGGTGQNGTDAYIADPGDNDSFPTYANGTDGAQGTPGAASGGDLNVTGGSTKSIPTITISWA